MTLSSLGWDDSWANHFQPFSSDGLLPARIALEHKHAYELLSASDELTAECTGKLRHSSIARTDLPAVGDWVAIRLRAGETRADIHAVLPRKTKFSRKAAGDVDREQIVAANVDTVFLVTALDHNFNLRRIERYLAVAWESGSQPVVVLSKSDLHPDPVAAQAEVAAVAIGAPVIALSAACGDGIDALDPWLIPGRTVAFLGSSGVGKSTLINRLLGSERQLTGAISDAVGKGRHTTTHRELIVAPSGVLVIDTPGMRELQLWNVETETLDTAFADVAAVALRCKFTNCGHRGEPGCAVQAALDDGTLDAARWQSYLKLQREQAFAARKVDPHLARETNSKWKKIHQQLRGIQRQKNRTDPE